MAGAGLGGGGRQPSRDIRAVRSAVEGPGTGRRRRAVQRGLLCPASVTGGGLRAAQLSEVRDAKAALTGLCLLLREVCEALVAVVLLADEDGMYWTCVEAMDTVDESRDRVAGILEKLEVRDRNPA